MVLKCVNTSLSVGTTTTQLFDDRSAGGVRQMMYVLNQGSIPVTIAMGDVGVTSGQGIVLAQNQSFIMSTDGGGACWQRQVGAITGSSTTTLSLVEVYDE